MSLAAIVEALFEAGATREMIVAAVRAHELAALPVTPVKSSAAERQKRYRERNKASRVTGDGITEVSDESDAETVTNVTKPITERNAPRARVRDITLNSEITGEDKTYLCPSSEVDGVTGDADLFGGPPPPPAKPKPKAERAFQIPKDWTPSPENRAYADEQGLTPEETDRAAIDFRDHFIDKQERRPGWDRSWQRWVRTACDRKRERAARMAGGPFSRGGGRGPVGLGEIISRNRLERGD